MLTYDVQNQTSSVSEAPSAPKRPAIALLHDLLASTSELAVASELRVSVRTLRRYAAGAMKMNWITQTRLVRMAEAAAARKAAPEPTPAYSMRAHPPRRRERASGSYARVASQAGAVN